MENKTIVFIGRSLDGFISGKNGELDWLELIPNPDNVDMGYIDVMNEVDAVVMGKTTYQTVLGFGIDWPYTKHVFVLSNSIKEIQADLEDKVTLLNGDLADVLNSIHNRGHHKLYIDGGELFRAS